MPMRHGTGAEQHQLQRAHLEARALAGARLLLDGHDLHDLVLQRRAQEGLHDLVLLHGQGEQVDLLQALDLALQAKCPLSACPAGP